MDNMPLVSVLIPAYNHENYIQETIKSVLGQTYKEIELIIVDDGSIDSTLSKIKEFEEICLKSFKHFYFETKENEGTCKTLNRLINLAKGKYIFFIASDDIVKENTIEKEVNFLENNPDYALVVGDSEFIDSKGKMCYWDDNQNLVYKKEEAGFLTFGQFLQEKKNINFNSKNFGTYKTLYEGNYIPNGQLIRKNIFDKIGNFTTEAPLEDYWLMLQISKYKKMKFINEVLFSYRIHNTNTIKDKSKMEKLTDLTKEYEDKILENINEDEVFSDVIEAKKYGFCYKIQGIPYILQILTYKKRKFRTKVIKLFNIPIMIFKKGV